MHLDAEATLESMNVIALDNKISSTWHLQTNDSGLFLTVNAEKSWKQNKKISQNKWTEKIALICVTYLIYTCIYTI